MNPLTPDHHFFIDQGTNARVRLVARRDRAQARRGAGVLDDPEDVIFLRYNELRLLIGDHEAFDAQTLVVRAARRARGGSSPSGRREWIGTATESQLAFPYYTLWGFPEKFHREPPETADRDHGLAASPGDRRGRRAPGRPRSTSSTRCKDGEILVCRMTNPAWVVLFTKIAGLVTDAGGVASHPAVVSASSASRRSSARRLRRSGSRRATGVRVNGATGVVEILRARRAVARAPARPPRAGEGAAARADPAAATTGPASGSSRRGSRRSSGRARRRCARRCGTSSCCASSSRSRFAARGCGRSRGGARRDLSGPGGDRGGRGPAGGACGSTATCGRSRPSSRRWTRAAARGRPPRAGRARRRVPPADRRGVAATGSCSTSGRRSASRPRTMITRCERGIDGRRDRRPARADARGAARRATPTRAAAAIRTHMSRSSASSCSKGEPR